MELTQSGITEKKKKEEKKKVKKTWDVVWFRTAAGTLFNIQMSTKPAGVCTEIFLWQTDCEITRLRFFK